MQQSMFQHKDKRGQPWFPPSTHGYFHKDDPPTSQAAAKEVVESGKLTAQMLIVHQAFQEHGACTAMELSQKSMLDYYLIQRRISDLKKVGKLVHTGKVRDKRQEYRVND